VNTCPVCFSSILPGAFFCEACGASVTTGNVVKKLRHSSFENITDAKGGLLVPGQRIKGRHTYIIEEAIARSGFGATFRAIRTKDDRQVLIKQMLEQSGYDKYRGELIRAFKRESMFLKKIKHPAFPKGFEYFAKHKSIYLVMEFINGKELSKALKEYRKKYGKVEDGLIVYLGIQIADALEVIHGYGYIYRDLKPQNVMLDGISSRVKLIDFGTLYHPSDKDPLIFESEGYTPPEFLVKNAKFTPAGDIYSLGAVLYEAATESCPSPDSNNFGSNRNPKLAQIIHKCIKRNPAERFQRAKHLRDELSSLTKKRFWPFTNKDIIMPRELQVLPSALVPSNCTFCEFCGFSDPKSQVGYCPKCRVPLKVGKLDQMENKERAKEFFLYSDETFIGSSSQSHFVIKEKTKEPILPKNIRIFRKNMGFWLEVLGNAENVLLNNRKIKGSIQLIDGDQIKLSEIVFNFSLKDAC